MDSLILNNASVWFWKPLKEYTVQWYIGLVSPNFGHCALQIEEWQLNAATDGSQWHLPHLYPEDHYYRNPDAIVKLGPTSLSGLVDYPFLEDRTSNKLMLGIHHTLREIGFDLKPKPNTCVELVKEYLGWQRDYVQTPDELFKELTR